MEEEQTAADSSTRKAVLNKRKGKSSPSSNLTVRWDIRRLPTAAGKFFPFIPFQKPPKPSPAAATLDIVNLFIAVCGVQNFILWAPISVSSSSSKTSSSYQIPIFQHPKAKTKTKSDPYVGTEIHTYKRSRFVKERMRSRSVVRLSEAWRNAVMLI